MALLQADDSLLHISVRKDLLDQFLTTQFFLYVRLCDWRNIVKVETRDE